LYKTIGFVWRRENWITQEKSIGLRKRTKNKLSLFVILSPGLEPRSHWFKMIAPITASSLFSNSG